MGLATGQDTTPTRHVPVSARIFLKYFGVMMTSYRKFLCSACGYIYDEAEGDPDSGIAPGTRWEDIPDEWVCPECGVDKSYFDLFA